MHLSPELVEIVARAGLAASDQPEVDRTESDLGTSAEPLRVECCYPDRWPESVIAVIAPPQVLKVALEVAAQDVGDLWPGRAVDDGALSLVAIGLQAALDVRRDPPATALLTGPGRWVTEPPDRLSISPTAVDTDQLGWYAP